MELPPPPDSTDDSLRRELAAARQAAEESRNAAVEAEVRAARSASEAEALRAEIARLRASPVWRLGERWQALVRAVGLPALRFDHALLVAILVWLGAALAFEVASTVHHYRRRATYRLGAERWRFGMPPVERMQRCADRLHRELPAGTRLVVPAAEADVHRVRWLAYLLPEHEVIAGGDPRALAADVLLVERTPPPAGATLVAGGGLCRVYRLP